MTATQTIVLIATYFGVLMLISFFTEKMTVILTIINANNPPIKLVDYKLHLINGLLTFTGLLLI